MSIHQILHKYWGYDSFRPLQEEIIQSVLDGKDTLALLPTGGGKSICFQVPAMALDGLCLVVSPLIALMKDQVENLEKIGIKAYAIFSGLTHQEIQIILGNCVHGGAKFLYVSPERLSTSLLRDHLSQMNISLLAIDEAHCISQWGFDFRPEYRKLKEIREYLPGVPIMALTATATARVVDDIQDQLGFKHKNAFRKSFERLNLHYVVRKNENKLEKLLNSVAITKGSGLIYVRNRKKTEEIAAYLIEHGINASFYHAGLTAELRQSRQDNWIKNKTRIMVCTNAFGMGIDKPDCRLVIHYEIPDCLEAYYQEAGRAGRNGNPAYCLLVYHSSDAEIMRARLAQNHPPESVLKMVYEGIGSYFHIPIGELNVEGFDFDLVSFSTYLKTNPTLVLNAIKLLSQLDVIHVSEDLSQPARVKMLMPGNRLYAFQVEYQMYDDLLKILLRTYGGIFDYYIPISEKVLGIKLNCLEREISEKLTKLHLLGVLDYVEKKNRPKLYLKDPRIKSEYLNLNPSLLRERKKIEEEKLESMIAFATNELVCRSRVLLSYFDEHSAIDCGACDVCKEKLAQPWEEGKIETLIAQLKRVKWELRPSTKELAKEIVGFNEQDLSFGLRILLDKGILQLDSQQYITWKKGEE
ncbi:MAG: recombinase RecQ [Bacteroidetes bacterium B1(2017)]|nr:MAG: recombinase RecQ [Bacteroidetes bacterium B1(2017)]